MNSIERDRLQPRAVIVVPSIATIRKYLKQPGARPGQRSDLGPGAAANLREGERGGRAGHLPLRRILQRPGLRLDDQTARLCAAVYRNLGKPEHSGPVNRITLPPAGG